jgi:glucokinase
MNLSGSLAIGIDIGGTNLRAAVVTSRGKIQTRLKEKSSGDIVATLNSVLKELITEDITGVGIGFPGTFDLKSNTVISAANLQALEGFCFNDLKLDVPLVVDNDANMSARAELWLGAGKEHKSFILMTLGTGIGSAIVHKGKLMNIQSEAGHMSIQSDGEKCACGNYGCLEMYASGRAIADAASDALQDGVDSILSQCCKGNIYRVTAEDVLNAALEGDILGRKILKNAGNRLGVGIANMIHLLNPDAVVLTGGLTGAWNIYGTEALHETGKRVLKGVFERTVIIPSTLGPDDTGVLGAARTVFIK